MSFSSRVGEGGQTSKFVKLNITQSARCAHAKKPNLQYFKRMILTLILMMVNWMTHTAGLVLKPQYVGDLLFEGMWWWWLMTLTKAQYQTDCTERHPTLATTHRCKPNVQCFRGWSNKFGGGGSKLRVQKHIYCNVKKKISVSEVKITILLERQNILFDRHRGRSSFLFSVSNPILNYHLFSYLEKSPVGKKASCQMNLILVPGRLMSAV